MKLFGSFCLLYLVDGETSEDGQVIQPIVNSCNLADGELGFNITVKGVDEEPNDLAWTADSDGGYSAILKLVDLSECLF